MRAQRRYRLPAEGLRVDPQVLLGTQAQDVVLETQAPPAAGSAVELPPGDVQHLVEVVGSRLRRALGPEYGDHLLPVQAMAGGEREQLHERLGLAQAPRALGDELVVDGNGEGAQQMDAHSGRGSGARLRRGAHV